MAPPATRPPPARASRSAASRNPPIVLLGPQRFEPTLADAVSAVGLSVGKARFGTITAGWQEREGEDADLHAHLAERTTNLNVYERAEDVWRRDRELHGEHKRRQELLRHKQDFYRIRLEHELEAAHVIQARKAPDEILEAERTASIEAIRQLDAYHLEQCARIHEEYDARIVPLRRAAVLEHRKELARLIDSMDAICIAGGHVATLLNRLELFGLGELLAQKPLFAWSAGAMVISEVVVLFHDSPPQGPGAAEVLDRGLGLARGVLPFPSPEMRLRLGDPARISLLTRRFAPRTLVTLTGGAHITWESGVLRRPFRVQRLHEDGRVEALGA
jgi:hypothetical protein